MSIENWRFWHDHGHFKNEDESRGALFVAYQAWLDGAPWETLGLSHDEYNAWVRNDEVPPPTKPYTRPYANYGTRPALARLEANPGGWSWVCHCPYCGEEHRHGGGGFTDNPRKYLSHRHSHCAAPDGKLLEGYTLIDENPAATDALIKRRKRLGIAK